MIQIRLNVFETNSSSTHSLVIMTEHQYNLWNSGILALKNESELVNVEKIQLRNIREELEELKESYNKKSSKINKKIEKLNDELCEHYHPKGSFIDKDGNFYWINGSISRETEEIKYTTAGGEKIVAISIVGSTDD